MCECCSQHAANHQGHVHINQVDCPNCFKQLEDALRDMPGVVSIEFVKEAQQAKVVFDKRILEITSLEEAISEKGFALS